MRFQQGVDTLSRQSVLDPISQTIQNVVAGACCRAPPLAACSSRRHWHGSRFAFDDGHVVQGPPSYLEHCLATRVRDGMIEVGPGAGLGRCRHERTLTEGRQAVRPETFQAPAFG